MRRSHARAARLAAVVIAFVVANARASDGGQIQSFVFIVSPDGDDTWSGRLAEPALARTDGPFATLSRAQQAVRAARATRKDASIAVLVRGGTYELEAPLVFESVDSGRPGAPVTWSAWPGERPVVSGGVRLSGWGVVRGRWHLVLPQVARGEWTFAQLFVNGGRRFRPRLPRTGYFTAGIGGEVAGNQLRAQPGDLRASWHRLGDIEVLGFRTWTMGRLAIVGVDEAAQIVTLTDPIARETPVRRYLVENVREALEHPGAWYLDRDTGELTYLPLPGERSGSATVVAPRLEHLLQIRGDVAGRRWVEWITFRGIAFAHTSWSSTGRLDQQAAVGVGAALEMTGARDFRFEGISVSHTGGYAVHVGAGSRRVTLDHCELSDLGAGGVKIGETSIPADPEAVASDNAVTDCSIVGGGRIHPSGVGVLIAQSPRNRIQRNDIGDLYYTGISVGWMWGYGTSAAHDNIIADNEVHDIGQGVLSDLGGIYTLGRSSGTVIRGNRIHDVMSWGYGGWGLYFDEGTSGVVAENNVVYRCKSGGLFQHYGRDNRIVNNVFALSREAQLGRGRVEPHLSFVFERNIVYWDRGALLSAKWKGDGVRFDRNIYWRRSRRAFDFAGKSLVEWQARGNDRNSSIADPMFLDPERGDFRLPPSSPARALGFVPFEALKPGARTRATASDRAFPAPPPPPAPVRISESFEGVAVGDMTPLAVTTEEGAARVRVTGEQASSGRRSLRFTDAPAREREWVPALSYDPSFSSGLAEVRFALRVEPGAEISHQWRDATAPYRVGPSLAVRADGRLEAGGRTIARLPPSTWVRFRILCGLGDRADGRWNLEIQIARAGRSGWGPPRRVRGLRADPGFDSLRWLGFSAPSAGPAVFYLDDLDARLRAK